MKSIKTEEISSDKKSIASECLNLRFNPAENRLQGVHDSSKLCNLESRPLYADTFGDKAVILGMTHDGRLIHDVSLENDEAVRVNKDLCRPESEVKEICVAGDYVVLNGENGVPEYLYKNAETGDYSYLGSVPKVPAHRVMRVAGPRIGVNVDSVTFRKKQSDLRNPTVDVTQPIAEAMKAAYKRGLREISGRYFPGSVLVCVALRMNDGELLAAGIPVAGCGIREAIPDAVTLQPIEESGYFTSTGAGTLYFPTNMLQVAFEEGIPAAWHSSIKQVEVWVTDVMGTDAEMEAVVGFQPASGLLSATLNSVNSENAAKRIMGGKMKLAATLKPWELPCSVDLMQPAGEAEESPFADFIPGNETNFGCITAHGGFLHCANMKTEYASPRSPFKPDAMGAGECRVAIFLSRNGEIVCKESVFKVDAPDNALQPFFYYPDSNAFEAVISLRDNQGRIYEGCLPLTATTDGRNAACWHQSGTTAYFLPAVEKWSETQAEKTSSYAEPGKVMTMKRGNPFVVKSITEHCGSPVRGMIAQPVGGGAYTRQFIYLFTDIGTLCLTHDNHGNHCVCRPISAQTPKGMKQVAASNHGVWMVSRSGELVRLVDSRHFEKSSGLNPESILFFDYARLELMIADPTVGLARIYGMEEKPCELKFRTHEFSPESSFLSSISGILEIRQSDMSLYPSLFISESTDAPCSPAVWRSHPFEIDAKGEALVFFYGEGDDLEIWVKCRDDETGNQRVLTRVQTSGICHFPILLPDLKGDFGFPHCPLLSFEVAGRIRWLSHFEILPINN